MMMMIGPGFSVRCIIAWVGALAYGPGLPIGAISSQGGQEPATLLRPGTSVVRDIKSRETHTFTIALESGQFLHLAVRQYNFDVELRLAGPTQELLAERNDATGVDLWPESLSIVAATPGVYTVQVRALATNGLPEGRYEMAIDPVRPATESDRLRSTAEAAFSDGNTLRAKDDQASLKSAIGKYKEANDLWRRIEAPDWEAHTLLLIADALIGLNEFEAATPLVVDARAIWTKLGSAAGQAHALTKLGLIALRTGKPLQALDDFRQSSELALAAGDRARAAGMLNNVGYIYSTTGQPAKALEYLERGLAEMKAMGDLRGQFSTINNIANVHEATGSYQRALDYHREALDLSRKSGVRENEAIALNNLGTLYSTLGKPDESLSFHSRSLALMRDLGDERGQATTLTNIGSLYLDMKQPEKALDAYQQALALRRSTKDRSGEAATLYNMGNLYNEPLRDYPKALDHLERAQAILRDLGERPGLSIVLGTTAKVLFRLKEPEKSRARFLESLQISREIGDRRSQSITLHLLATTSREAGDLLGAREYIEESLAIKESLRRAVDVSDLRASFFATVQSSYEFYIDLLMRLHRQQPSGGYDRLAFEAAERARARRLLDTAAAGQADIRRDVDRSLLDQERDVQRKLGVAAQKQAAVLARTHSEAEATAAKADVDGLLHQLEQAEAAIKRASPSYAALVQPEPLKTAAIQAELGPNDVLLEFVLGDDSSVLWAVSADRVSTFELPKRSEVNALAARYYEHLSARTRHPPDEGIEQWQRRVAAADRDLRATGASLSGMLLGPARALLPGRRLLIAAVGALQSVPFAALPVPGDPALEPLVARHDVVMLPSASTIALQRRTRTAAAHPKTIAVFADPVFDPGDPRVIRAATSIATAQSAATAASSDKPKPAGGEDGLDRAAAATGLSARGGRLPRLRFSRDEAIAILALARPAERSRSLDFDANLETATNPSLASFRIVHIATHAFLNGDHPELSGIALSSVDRRGNPVDGFLRLHQIYGLRLPAELVVLSACQTALGRDLGGEGIVGLTRGFMYAGAAAVVASLWKVDDQATSELMKLFYQGMLGPKRLRPAAALRAAQDTLSKHPRWASPHYWAGFVLEGEWR